MHEHIAKAAENAAPLATYGGSAATIMFWGLQISDLCAIISTVIAGMGFGLQAWSYWRKNRQPPA